MPCGPASPGGQATPMRAGLERQRLRGEVGLREESVGGGRRRGRVKQASWGGHPREEMGWGP